MILLTFSRRGEERDGPAGDNRARESLTDAHEWPLMIGKAYAMSLWSGFHSGESGRGHRSLRLLVISGIKWLALDSIARSEIDSEKVRNRGRYLLCIERTIVGGLTSCRNTSSESHQPCLLSAPYISPM